MCAEQKVVGGAAGGERRITIREGACHRGVQAAALLRNGVWLQGRGRGQRQEEGAGRRGYKQQDYFWPIQFPLTGSLKLKIGHIVLVLSSRRYCGLMSLEQSDPSKIEDLWD
ncbi:hypothetical protein ACQJBY_001057 [Aegilops geniculata]